jgi:hypothetical protein
VRNLRIRRESRQRPTITRSVRGSSRLFGSCLRSELKDRYETTGTFLGNDQSLQLGQFCTQHSRVLVLSRAAMIVHLDVFRFSTWFKLHSRVERREYSVPARL